MTYNSLVILDEPGNGTDPNEGECLAIAVLEYLLDAGCFCAVTTHFSKLKTFGKRHKEIMVASVEFNEEEMKPTYRFIEGITGQSNALEIARRLGLSEEILDRAKELKISSRTREEALIEQLEKSLAEARRREDELKKEESELQKKQDALSRELEKVQSSRDVLLEEARKEAQVYLEEAKEETDTLMKLLRQSESMHEAIAIKHEIDTKSYEEPVKEEVVEEEEEHEFVTGDYVAIRNTNQRGTIDSIKKDKAVINVNGLKITSSLSDLRYLKEKPQKEKKRAKRKGI